MPTKLPGWYTWLTLFMATLASVGIGIGVSAELTHRAIGQSEEQQRRQTEQTRIATCLVVVTQVAVYEDSPPATPTGKRAAAAWNSLSQQLRCEQK